MSVYIIVRYEVEDHDAYKAYPPAVGPLLVKHGGELLVADTQATVLEGKSDGTNVVLRFDSEEAAKNFYNDPEYAPYKKLRIDATKNGNMVMAKEFVPPSA